MSPAKNSSSTSEGRRSDRCVTSFRAQADKAAKAPINNQDLNNFLSDKLANYKIPEIIIYTNDPLPRIASEKIDRVSIKKLLS